MKQLCLFESARVDLLSKLAEERAAKILPRSHWNGEPW